MKTSTILTSQLLALSLHCLPPIQAEEIQKLPEVATLQETSKSEQAIALLKKFAKITQKQNLELLKIADPKELVDGLQKQEQDTLQTIRSLYQIYNLPVNEFPTKLTTENFAQITKPLIPLVFQDNKTILFPRSLIFNEGHGIVFYGLAVTISNNHQALVKPHEYQIFGLLPNKGALPVSWHQLTVPFFEVQIVGGNEVKISKLPPSDFSITNETGAVIFKERFDEKIKVAYKNISIPVDILEHAMAVRVITLAMADMSANIPENFKHKQQDYSKLELGQFLADYKFLASSKGLGLELLAYDLMLAEQRRDPQYKLSQQIIKESLALFISEQEYPGSPLNQIIAKEIGENKQQFPQQIAQLKADLEKRPAMETISELFTLATKHHKSGLVASRPPLMQSFYNCYYNYMADEIDRIRETLKN